MNKLFTALLLLCCSHAFCQSTSAYNIKEFMDLIYVNKSVKSPDSLQKLNLVIPENNKNYPLFIWIGGGAWSYGDKNVEMDLARKLAQAGIAVASVGHRLSPATWRDSSLKTGIQHPEHIKDVAAAVKWLYHNASQYNYDINKIFIGGYSSGAHLATLISLDSTYLAKEGLSTHVFKGIIPISGAYDILEYYKVFLNGNRPELAELHVQAVFGNTEDALIHASPTSYLAHLSTPMLVMSDNNMYNYTRLWEDKIRATSFRNMQVVYSYDLSHGALWRNLSLETDSFYRNMIIHFINNHSKAAEMKG